jgi:hypothetical protein
MRFAGFADSIGVTNVDEKVFEVCRRFGTDLNMNVMILRANMELLLQKIPVGKNSKLDANMPIFGLPSTENVNSVLVCVFPIWMCVCVVCF